MERMETVSRMTLLALLLAGCTAGNGDFGAGGSDGGPSDGALANDGATGPTDRADMADPATSPDLLGCAGYVDPAIGGCWYVAPGPTTCDAVCEGHGGFDAAGTRHQGDPIMRHFFPQSRLVPCAITCHWWEAVGEQRTADGGLFKTERIQANGSMPNGNETPPAGTYLACSCVR